MQEQLLQEGYRLLQLLYQTDNVPNLFSPRPLSPASSSHLMPACHFMLQERLLQEVDRLMQSVGGPDAALTLEHLDQVGHSQECSCQMSRPQVCSCLVHKRALRFYPRRDLAKCPACHRAYTLQQAVVLPLSMAPRNDYTRFLPAHASAHFKLARTQLAVGSSLSKLGGHDQQAPLALQRL